MKAVIYVTKRVMYKWPQMYIDELVAKLQRRDYDVSVISDDTIRKIAKREIESADLFIGVPNKFDELCDKAKRIRLLGATTEGEGVVSSVQCAGCVENQGNPIDCMWSDELCMYEITPNDILEDACI